MKIKRFTASSMQAGLKLISETLGPEAVILSNRRLSNGFEIVAGVDEAEYELYQSTEPAQSYESDIIKAAGAQPSKALDSGTMKELFAAMSEKNQKAFPSTNDSQDASIKKHSIAPSQTEAKPELSSHMPSVAESNPNLVVSNPVTPNAVASNTVTPISKAASELDRSDIHLLRQEIDGLKDLLKEQTEQLKVPLTPVDVSPQYERLEQRLYAMGFNASLSRKLLSSFDREQSLDMNWRSLMARLSASIPTALYEPLANGGVYALTGPTGAGKTTTIAKLAAHGVKDFGAQSVAVISLDWFQVGGQEILRSVTDILGVDFYPLNEKESLLDLLARLTGKHLVLIDTSGSAEALAHWNKMMQHQPLDSQIQKLLVVPAIMHSASINQFVQMYSMKKFDAVILSKLDEANSFGSVLEPIIKFRWPIWYYTAGQKIPQDIVMADSKKIVRRLIDGLKKESLTLATAS